MFSFYDHLVSSSSSAWTAVSIKTDKPMKTIKIMKFILKLFKYHDNSHKMILSYLNLISVAITVPSITTDCWVYCFFFRASSTSDTSFYVIKSFQEVNESMFWWKGWKGDASGLTSNKTEFAAQEKLCCFKPDICSLTLNGAERKQSGLWCQGASCVNLCQLICHCGLTDHASQPR